MRDEMDRFKMSVNYYLEFTEQGGKGVQSNDDCTFSAFGMAVNSLVNCQMSYSESPSSQNNPWILRSYANLPDVCI